MSTLQEIGLMVDGLLQPRHQKQLALLMTEILKQREEGDSVTNDYHLLDAIVKSTRSST